MVSGLDFGAFLPGGTPQTTDPNDDVTRIHIHNAPRGQNGGIVLGLVDTTNSTFNGQDADDLRFTRNPDGSTTITGIWEQTDPSTTPVSAFVRQIREAAPGSDVDLYWNIQTRRFPEGEIRGQLISNGTTSLSPTPGDDVITLAATGQTVQALAGNDQVIGGAGNDVMNGNQGNDTLAGNGGNDFGLGGKDNDLLSGGIGNDILNGNRGNDAVSGDAGDDLLYGGKGNDNLNGGEGNDTLVGGFGVDLLLGGVGADVFALSAGTAVSDVAQADIIQDFQVGVDRIGLSASLTAANLTFSAVGTNTIISLSGSSLVLAVVNGVTSNQLQGSFVSVNV